MDCIDPSALRDIVRGGGSLSKPTKRELIAQIFRDRPELLAQALAHFEPRLDVRYDTRSNSFQVADAHHERLLSAAHAAVEHANELAMRSADGETVRPFDDTTDDLLHLSNTAVVNRFLASIPLLAGTQATGFVNPVQAKDLLWRLAAGHRGYVTDYPQLRGLLRDHLTSSSRHTNATEDLVLQSLDTFLFAEEPIRFRDIYGNLREQRSAFAMAHDGSLEREVRARNKNNLDNLIVTVASVNDTRSLSFATRQGIFKAKNDGVVEQKANISRSVAFRLYEIDAEAGRVRLSQRAKEQARAANLQVRPYGQQGHKDRFLVSALVGGVHTHIPFTLNSSKRQDVAVVDALEDFLESDPLAGDASHYRDPDTLAALFELAGFGDVVDTRLLEDFLDNPKRAAKQPLQQLYQMAANNLVAIAMSYYHEAHAEHSLGAYSPFPPDLAVSGGGVQTDTTVKRLAAAIAAVTQHRDPRRNARNLSRTLRKVFTGEEDMTAVNGFVDSPLMFFVNTAELARQRIETHGLYRNQTQYNVAGDAVNKNTVVSNVENLHRKVGEVRGLVERGQYTALATNPYVRGSYGLEALFSLDGFRDEDRDEGKAQMSMNERDILDLIHGYFAEGLMKSYEPAKGAFVSDYFPEVNSDKSNFAGHTVRTDYDQFPLVPDAGGKLRVDAEALIKEVLKQELSHRTAFRTQFVRAWVNSGLVSPLHTTADVNALLAEIEATPIPAGGVPLLANKYWVKGPEGRFAVKGLVKEFLQPFHHATRRRELLEAFARNHKKVVATGLTFAEEVDEWLGSLTSDAAAGTVANAKTGAVQQMAAARGVVVPPRLVAYDTKGMDEAQLYRAMQQNAHPLEIAHYFNWMAVAPPISRLLTGEIFQYKGETWHEMLRDRLKRSVASVAPFMRMSLDTTRRLPYDRRMPRHGRVLHVADATFPLADILGTGKQVDDATEVYDGGSLTFELPELMYQASFGGTSGLFPHASLKFIYPHTDNVSGDSQLLKYAVHTVTTEWWKQGSPEVEHLFRVFLDTVPLGRAVRVEATFGEHGLTADYAENQTLYDVLVDILATGTPLNPMELLADVIATNFNPVTGQLDLKDKYVTQVVFGSSAKTGQYRVHQMEDLRRLTQSRGRLAPGAFNWVDHVDMGMQLDATHDPHNTSIAIISQAYTASVLENRAPALATELLGTLGAIGERGQAAAARVLAGTPLVEDTFRATLADGTVVTVPRAAITRDRAGVEQALGQPVTARTLVEEADITHRDLQLDGVEIAGFPNLGDPEAFADYQARPEFRPHARRLFLRAIALKAMDRQGIYNTTYMAVEDNSFNMQDPQIERVVLSAANSWLGKKTVSHTFSGGQYVLTPTHGLIQVYDALDRETGKTETVMRAALDVLSADGQPRFAPQGPARELKWKGYVKADGSNAFDSPQYRAYANALAVFQADSRALTRELRVQRGVLGAADLAALQHKVEAHLKELRAVALQARLALQRELEEGGYTATPAEFIMPYSFKRDFGLRAGMQPFEVTEDFFAQRLRRMSAERRLLMGLLSDARDADFGDLLTETRHRLATELVARRPEIEALLGDYEQTYETEVAVSRLLDGIFQGMDRQALVDRIAAMDTTLDARARQMYQDFRKTLAVLVNRIPNSGMQSIVTGKVVGFMDGNANAIFIPTELMIIQGADLDIDKATVQQHAVSREGQVYEPVLGPDGQVDRVASSVKALQNHLTRLLAAINDHPGNALQVNTSVSMALLARQAEKRAHRANQFHPDEPHTVVDQKILTAEGKAMTGLEANGLKMYGIAYYVRQLTGRPLEPLRLELRQADGRFGFETFTDIANADPYEAAEQAWEFYSALVNAATDNAKEMILGAIGANLQTGNMINAMVMYNMDAGQLFDLLSDEAIAPVLLRMRHAGNIHADRPTSLTIEEAIRAQLLEDREDDLTAKDRALLKQLPTQEVINRLAKKAHAPLLRTLLKLGQVGEEFGVGASLLSVNRQIPVTMYDKFHYRQKLENHLNRKFEQVLSQGGRRELAPGEAVRFDFGRFVREDDYGQLMENLAASYDLGQGHRVVEAVNLLALLRHAPHIKANLAASFQAGDALKEMAPLYRKAEELIRHQVAQATPRYRFRNVNENEYNAVVRYLREVQVKQFLSQKQLTLSLSGASLSFDLSQNEDISGFVYLFPEYLRQLRQDNPALSRNLFYRTLDTKTDAKGQYLVIPNIDQLGEGMLFDLRFALNNTQGPPLRRSDGTALELAELQQQVFLYALTVGKGVVSKTSFFELFEPAVKQAAGYTAFLERGNALDLAGVDTALADQSIHLKAALARFMPAGEGFITPRTTTTMSGRQVPLRNQSVYAVNVEVPVAELPQLIALYKDGGRRLYSLTRGRGNRSLSAGAEYALVQPLFPTVAISADTTGRPTHTTANRVRKSVTDPGQIASLLQGAPTPLEVRVPPAITDATVLVDSNLGVFRYDRKTGTATLLRERITQLAQRPHTARTRAAAGKFIHAMTQRLSELFPKVDVELVDTAQMVARYGEREKHTAAFAEAGKVVFNTDIPRLDMPMHEFGHVFMWDVRQRQPAVYRRLVDLALAEQGMIARHVRALYPDLEGDRLGEEIFVHILGYRSVDELALAATHMPRAWADEVWDSLGEFLDESRELLADVTGADRLAARRALADLDLRQATLWDFVNSFSYDMLHGTVRDLVPPESFERMRARMDTKPVSSVKDLLGTLVDDAGAAPNKRGAGSKRRQKQLEAMQEYVRNGYSNDRPGKPPIFSGYQADKLTTLMEKVLPASEFNKFTDNVYTLGELTGKMRLTSAHTGKGKPTSSITVDFGKMPPADPDVLVKVSILGGQVEFELINLANRHFRHYNKHLKREGLAGVFVPDREWKALGGTFEANQRDLDLLRLGYYGVRLKEAVGAKARVNGLFTVDDTRDNPDQWVKGTSIEEAVINLEALTRVPGLDKALSGKLRATLTRKNALDPAAYRADLHQYYKSFVARMGHVTTGDNQEEFVAIGKLLSQTRDTQKLIDILAERQAILLGRDKDGHRRQGAVANEEIKVLGELLLQLEDVRDLYRVNKESFVNAIQRYLANPQASGSGVMGYIHRKLTDAMSRVRQKMMVEHMPAHQRLQDALVADYRSRNTFSLVEDWTLNDARKFFDSMLEKVDAVDAAGNRVRVYTGRVTGDRTALTAAQRAYLDYFEEQVHQGYAAMYPKGKGKTRGYIPLMKISGTEALKDVLDPNTGKTLWGRVKEGSQRWWDNEFNNMDYHHENIDGVWVDDRFRGQFEPGGKSAYGNDTRLALLGLADKGGQLTLWDKEANRRVERDLSTVLDHFVANAHKKAEFSKVVPHLQAVRAFVEHRGRYNNANDKTLETLNEFYDRFVNNKMDGSEEFANVNKALLKAGGLASLAMLGLNFKSNVANFTTGFVGNLKEGMLQGMAGLGAQGQFGATEILKADALVVANWEMSEQLNNLFGHNQMDFQNMLHQRHRHTDMAKFGAKTSHWLNFIGDAYNRHVMFRAQMLKDGSNAAYRMEAGKLVYDERRDPRFFAADGTQTAAQKLLYDTLRENMRREGTLDKDGKMTRGYDNRQRNSLKQLSDKVHGTYDNELGGSLHNYALGRLFLMFKKYMVNKFRQYITDGKGGARYNEAEGRYVERTLADGTVVLEWEGTWTEGVWVTFGHLMRDLLALKRTAWSNLQPHQKLNMLRMGTDVALLSLLAWGLAAALGDDDELGVISGAAARGAQEALSVGVNPMPFAKAVASPFVTADWLVDQLGNAFGLFSGDFVKGRELLKNVPGVGMAYVSNERVQEFAEAVGAVDEEAENE